VESQKSRCGIVDEDEDCDDAMCGLRLVERDQGSAVEGKPVSQREGSWLGEFLVGSKYSGTGYIPSKVLRLTGPGT
jgi:hypothetical protein